MMLGALLFASIPSLRAKPKSPRVQLSKPLAPKASDPLRGERLPIPEYHDIERDMRNNDWQSLARALRVRDLKVYAWWASSYNSGVVEWQKKHTLQQLKAAGYKVQKFNWQLGSGLKTTGFEAWRGKEKLSAMWNNNGLPLFLYWGHQEPETPAQKRDDALIEAAIQNKPDAARAALRQGANPLALDYSGASVLMLATSGGHAEIVRQLLDAQRTRPSEASSTDFGQTMQSASATTPSRFKRFSTRARRDSKSVPHFELPHPEVQPMRPSCCCQTRRKKMWTRHLSRLLWWKSGAAVRFNIPKSSN